MVASLVGVWVDLGLLGLVIVVDGNGKVGESGAIGEFFGGRGEGSFCGDVALAEGGAAGSGGGVWWGDEVDGLAGGAEGVGKALAGLFGLVLVVGNHVDAVGGRGRVERGNLSSVSRDSDGCWQYGDIRVCQKARPAGYVPPAPTRNNSHP